MVNNMSADPSENMALIPTIQKGENWSRTNTMTLLKWVTIGSCYIQFLDKSISKNRMFIRVNTIQSIVMTTATGSIGVSQISSIFSQEVQLILTLLFTFMSFFLTISTGVIKVCLIHENLEKYIQVRQEWASFITNISTELQLPIEERQDALKLIGDNKNTYLSLLNKDIEMTEISVEESAYMTRRLLKKFGKKEVSSSSGSPSSLINIFKDNNNREERDFIVEETMKEYSNMINTVGITISDITNGIVKNEITAIVEREFTGDTLAAAIKKRESEADDIYRQRVRRDLMIEMSLLPEERGQHVV
jgi:hypothetical protein